MTIEILDKAPYIGLPTHHIQILSNGVIIADLPGHTGLVGTASSWPTTLGKLAQVQQVSCRQVRWPVPVSLNISGNTYLADEINVLAEGVNGTIDYLSDFVVRASGIPDFTIVSEQSTPVDGECPPANVQIQKVGNTHVLTWSGDNYHLQVSSDLSNGEWTDVPGFSPVVLPLTTESKFKVNGFAGQALLAELQGDKDAAKKRIADTERLESKPFPEMDAAFKDLRKRLYPAKPIPRDLK